MAGSGTVLARAASLGHQAIGFDIDPLSVMMATVATSRYTNDDLSDLIARLSRVVNEYSGVLCPLPWIDKDPETVEFIDYWYGKEQYSELRLIAFAIEKVSPYALRDPRGDFLRIALSRIIVTKDRGASLARDVSHSRPHRVSLKNEFDVTGHYLKSLRRLKDLVINREWEGAARVSQGDARCLDELPANSIDAVVTSPPYLNAIDYLRGHRLALIWFGFTISQLRVIRGESIGSERRGEGHVSKAVQATLEAMGEYEQLPLRQRGFIIRYAQDLISMTKEVQRTLRIGGTATFVVGNSCLKGIYLSNSDAVRACATDQGLKLTQQKSRSLPSSSRYLPVTGTKLANRMKEEVILTFEKAGSALHCSK